MLPLDSKAAQPRPDTSWHRTSTGRVTPWTCRVSIGQNAVIAAGAVLTAGVPENTAAAAGVPARVVRHPHEDA